MYFDKVRALSQANKQANKPSIEEENYVNQFDPKLQKNFSYTDTFKKMKDIYSLPMYSSEKVRVNSTYTPTQPAASKFL